MYTWVEARVNALVEIEGEKRPDRRFAREARERRVREASINVALTIDVRHKSRAELR